MISIQARLAISLLLGSAVICGGGAWLLDRQVRESLGSLHDEAIVSRAWALANALQRDEGRIELEDLHGISAALQAGSDPLYFEVWKRDGSLAGRSPTLGSFDLPRVALEDEEPRLFDVALPPDGRPGRAATIQVELYDEQHEDDEAGEATLDHLVMSELQRDPVELLTIVVAEDLSDLKTTMRALRSSVAMIGALSFTLSALYLGWSLRRGLAPLNRLAERARMLDARSLHLGFGREELPRELATVRDRANELLGRVQSAFAREQRITAALAHELRTPVADLRMLAEVSLRGPEAPPDRAFQAGVLSVSRRMQSLIESLLALHRAESGAEKIELGPVALDSVLEDLIEDLGRGRERDRVTQVAPESDAVLVQSNEGLLRPILGNLLSNAIEYSPDDASVTAEISVDSDQVTVSVRNPAPDLSPPDVAMMFEPFWRKSSAGSSSEHSGLGLALAQSLARALGCELAGELDPNGILSIRLTGLRRAAE